MLDEIIKGATVVDGTGAPGVVTDVGIADGRVVAVGPIDLQDLAGRQRAQRLYACPRDP